MREIRKRPEPRCLTQWRQERIAAGGAPGMEFTYDGLRTSPCIRQVEEALSAEQGGLCAYTGHRLERHGAAGVPGFHVEHVCAQRYCTAQNGLDGFDTSYANMVACWPASNRRTGVPYGEPVKGDWPDPCRRGDFVLPLQPGCAQRFKFLKDGTVSAASADDTAATTTIERLRLNHAQLVELRRKHADGFLQPRGKYLSLSQCRRQLEALQAAERALNAGVDEALKPFCFVLSQVLERRIRKLEARSGKVGG